MARITQANSAQPLAGLLAVKRRGSFSVSPFEAVNQLCHFHAALVAAQEVFGSLAKSVDFIHVQPTGTGLTKDERKLWGEVDLTAMRDGVVELVGEVSAAAGSLQGTKRRASAKKLKLGEKSNSAATAYLFFMDDAGAVHSERVLLAVN